MENTFSISEVAKGVRLCSYKTDRFKTGRISFNIAVPLGQNASAFAILPYLISRSSGKYTSFTELNARLAELYGAIVTPSVSKIGEAQILRLSMTMIDDRFAFEGESIYKQCAELLCDLLFLPNIENGAFNSEEVKREKRLLLERIESEKNDKRVYALRRCEEIMCKSEPYGINCLGNAHDVEELTPQGIYDAWQELIKTAVVLVNVVGDADDSEIASMVKSRFESIARDEICNINTTIIEKAEKANRVNEEMQINQGKLVLGYRAGISHTDENFGALRVMVDLFGGAPYSKLFTNVREKMSLCYYCSARLNRQKGIIMVQSGIEKANEEKAINEIANQLEMMQNGEFTGDELNASITGLKDTLMRVTDTPEDIDAWGYSQTIADSFKSPQDIINEIQYVTAEEVREAAQKVTLDTIYMLSGEEGKENE